MRGQLTHGGWRRIMPTHWGWALIALACWLAGLLLAAISMFMAWKFGEGFGVDDTERYAYGAMHAALHVVSMVTSFCIGGYLQEKRPVRASLAMLIVMAVGAYSIQNIAGFAAKNRVAISDALELNNKRATEAYEAQKAYLQTRINWAADVTMNVRDYPPAARVEAKRQRTEYEKQLHALKPPVATVSNVTGDAATTVFARLTGWAPGTMQASSVILLAILAYIGEVYMFVQGTDRAARAWGLMPVSGVEAIVTDGVKAAAANEAENGDGVSATKESIPINMVPQKPGIGGTAATNGSPRRHNGPLDSKPPALHASMLIEAAREHGICALAFDEEGKPIFDTATGVRMLRVTYPNLLAIYDGAARAVGYRPIKYTALMRAVREVHKRERKMMTIDGLRERVITYLIPETPVSTPTEAQPSPISDGQ